MAIPALLAALARSAGGAATGEAGSALSAAKAAGGKAEIAAAKGNLQQSKALAGTYQKVAGAATAAYSAMTHIPEQLNQLATFWVKTLTTGADAVRALAGPMKDFVGLSNPAAVKQFDLAMRDMHAVIGRMLLPIFNSLTGAARVMGDTYATVEKYTRSLTNAIGGALFDSFKALGDAMKDNAYAVKLMADTLTAGVVVMGKITAMTFRILSMFGIASGINNRGPGESGRGAAVRNVSIGASGEDAQRKATEAAFMQGMGGKQEDPAVNKLGSIEIVLNNILTTMGLFPTKKDVADFISGIASGRSVAGAAANTARDPLGTLGAIARFAASNVTR